ncbi:MAG: pyridoxal-phosphate dependent enzyme [Granulosicoccus sp.]
MSQDSDLQPQFKPDFKRALACVSACPIYTPTPIVEIEDQGVTVSVKDESPRLALGSFKALGGVYAVAQLILEEAAAKLGHRPAIETLLSDDVRSVAKAMTFVCASAGNHGLAVAAGSKLFGANARVYLSEEVPKSFAKRLQDHDATVCVSGATYEESLLAANQDADDTGAYLLADGSWPGYTYRPSLVMEGYTVIASELCSKYETTDRWPSDVYLQAGVGGMAAALAFMIRKNWRVQPRIVIVEPSAADCLAISAAQNKMIEATGPVSNMGRLDCKAASLLAFETLRDCDVHYLAISDDDALQAVACMSDYGLHTTPSGAAGFAAWQIERSLAHTSGDRPLVIMSEQA